MINLGTAAAQSARQKQKVSGKSEVSENMPYVSSKQRAYFNANRNKIGPKVVDEFNEASKGMKLPERIPKKHWASRGIKSKKSQ